MVRFLTSFFLALSLFYSILADEYCRTSGDCYTNGKKCDGIQDVGCICKKGFCKISSGCGTTGAFFRTGCGTCNEEDCEDEGACKWTGSQCLETSRQRTACLSTSSSPCIFPFTYQGVVYNSCTRQNSVNGAAWCAVRVNQAGEVLRNGWEDCTDGCPGKNGPDETCNTEGDCYANGKKCDGIQDASCICKKGQCKISSGCGKMGAFFRTGCGTCNEEDCEDEGACRWSGSTCMETSRPRVTGSDESCFTPEDCYTNGKKCDGIQDVGCICKKGFCKISSGCGTTGAFFRTGCGTCNEEDCEDEGACKWTGSQCMETSRRRTTCLSTSSSPCIFPFTYQGVVYNSCTRQNSVNGAAWCAVRVNQAGEVLRNGWEDCTDGCPGKNGPDETCNTEADCYSNGKKCDGIQDASCICKRGQCKISSGCGTTGAFFRTSCGTCNAEDCEDEGACKWTGTRCISN